MVGTDTDGYLMLARLIVVTMSYAMNLIRADPGGLSLKDK